MTFFSWNAHRWLKLSGVALVCLGSAAIVHAQPQVLDRSQLLEGLIHEQMHDLVDHLLATEPTDDPIERRYWQVVRLRLEYNDPTRPREQRIAIFSEMRKATLALLEAAPEHPRRPIWLTDLAERLMTDWLEGLHLQALSFYEFGHPTLEQSAAVEPAISEALQLLRQAEAELAATARRAAGNAQLRHDLEASGLWQRLFEEYREHRTRFFFAQAAYLLTRLPDSAMEERNTLLKEAALALEPLAEDTTDLAGIRPLALRLLGQIRAAEGRGTEAIRSQLTAAVRSETPGSFRRVQAALTLAQVQTTEKQFAAALETLAEVAGDPLVLRTPLLMLLLTDARHRALMAEAEATGPQQAGSRQTAYQVYEELFDHPALGAAADSLRTYVFSRWADQVPPGAETELPPTVRSAVAEVLVTRGQQQMLAAQARADAADVAVARAALVRAETLCRTLQADPAPEEARARALYNLGRAIYWQDRSRLERQLQAAAIWTDVGQRYSRQPVAEAAMELALSVLVAEHQRRPEDPRITGAFARAGEVLFERFPTSRTADDLRVYYAFHVLQKSGQYARALSVYEPVPFDHAGYFDARVQILFCLERLLDEAEAAEKEELCRQLARQAEEVYRAADGNQRPAARQALAAARLALARVAVEEGQPQNVLSWLDAMEPLLETEAGAALLPRVFERRAEAFLALDQTHLMQQQVGALLALELEVAAPHLDALLNRLEARIAELEALLDSTADDARQVEHQRAIENQAVLALPIARHLSTWASSARMSDLQRLPFELAQLRLARLAGEQALAEARVAPLLHRYPDQGLVLLEAAETLFAGRDRHQWLEAAGLFDRLIAASGQAEPLPPVFWQAWLRRLQISERLQHHTSDIHRRVRLLERRDPNLGNPRIRAALNALRDRHS